jgi:hypothetical protein
VADKRLIAVTATKILDGAKKAYTYNGSGLEISVDLAEARWVPVGASGEDTLFILPDGTQITAQVSYDDVNTATSASDETGS